MAFDPNFSLSTGEIEYVRTIEGRSKGGGIRLGAYRGGFGGNPSITLTLINSTVSSKAEGGIFNNGAQDVLIVEGMREDILIPMTREIVIREEEGKLIVDPPPGLLELNSEADM